MFILRWFIFLTIGLLGQIAIYFLYPLLCLYWAIFVYDPIEKKLEPIHDYSVSTDYKTIANGHLLDNEDTHGALTQYGFIQKEGLELLQVDGALLRKYHDNQKPNQDSVSGDVVIAWFFANLLADRKVSDETLKKVVDHYIKNLGTTSNDSYGKGYVSDRSSNFGINYSPDSEAFGLTLPAFGPQYYTTASVLASAYHLGFKYKALFWTHFVVMGGWYWAWIPMLYPDYDTWWYVRDNTMKSLYIQLQVFGPKWWITKPMKFINDKTLLFNNDLFDAMMKRPISDLPESMDAFFSQRADASSTKTSNTSPYIPKAIRKIQEETKYIE